MLKRQIISDKFQKCVFFMSLFLWRVSPATTSISMHMPPGQMDTGVTNVSTKYCGLWPQLASWNRKALSWKFLENFYRVKIIKLKFCFTFNSDRKKFYIKKLNYHLCHSTKIYYSKYFIIGFSWKNCILYEFWESLSGYPGSCDIWDARKSCHLPLRLECRWSARKTA